MPKLHSFLASPTGDHVQDLRALSAMLQEARSRGLDLPEEMFKKVNLTWNKPNGYFPKMDGSLYNPTEIHKAFIAARGRFVGLFAGRGAGKTGAGAQKALAKIESGEPGAVMNPDFENFKLSTWPEFREWIPWENVVAAHQYRRSPEWQPYQPFNLVFKNGVKVICKGLKEPDSARGPNINWLWYDEGGRDETGEPFQVAVASVRIGKEPQSFVTTTPKGKYHWIYKFFVEKNIPEDALEAFEKEGLGRELIEMYYMSLLDNQDNLDPGFFASLLAAYPAGWLRQQEVFGKFVDAGGNLADSSWFRDKMVDEPPEEVNGRIRYWDLAATEKKISKHDKKNDPDETVGTLMSMVKRFEEKDEKKIYIGKNDFYIEEQQSGFWEWDDIKSNIVRVAKEDGIAVKVVVEQEPASGGKNQVAELNSVLQKEIPGHPGCEGYRPEGDRIMLANIWFAEAKEGFVYIVKGDWVKGFFEQVDTFPNAKHDDKITSVSGARINLSPVKKWKRIKFLKL